MDFGKLLNELSQKASETAKDLELDKRVEQGKEIGADVIEKIKTDRSAQIKAGGGALLLAMLLGTSGGRKLVGSTAKVGAVAGLGALAYRAWMKKNGRSVSADATTEASGFLVDESVDELFAEALIRAMISAAWADGALDQAEHRAIANALDEAGSDAGVRKLLLNEESEADNLEIIAQAAHSPNHAAQLYAAAAIVSGDPNSAEASFLNRLADALGIESGHASAIRSEVVA